MGREIAYRQQISLPKPGDMLVRGQRNCLQTADFSVQAGRILSRGQRNLSQGADFSVQAGRYAVAWAESSAHMRSKICKKAYLFDKEKHLW